MLKASAQDVETALDAAEQAVARGAGLEGTGFWKAVARVRRSETLSEMFADRIAAVDRAAFTSAVRLRVPAGVGVAALALATAAGIGALFLVNDLSRPMDALVFLGAFGVLDVSTHSLAHWLVGRVMGMRFTHFFIGGPPPPRPGAKLDYSTYLRTAPRRRAFMHASGAVVTKLIPFTMIWPALHLKMPLWVLAVLVAVGGLQILTDVLFSTKTSDWKKVRRELRAAKAQARV